MNRAKQVCSIGLIVLLLAWAGFGVSGCMSQEQLKESQRQVEQLRGDLNKVDEQVKTWETERNLLTATIEATKKQIEDSQVSEEERQAQLAELKKYEAKLDQLNGKIDESLGTYKETKAKLDAAVDRYLAAQTPEEAAAVATEASGEIFSSTGVLGPYTPLALLLTNALTFYLRKRAEEKKVEVVKDQTRYDTAREIIAPMAAARVPELETRLNAETTPTGANYIVLNKTALAPAHAANRSNEMFHLYG